MSCFFADGNLRQVSYSQHQQGMNRFLHNWHTANAVTTASLCPFLILPLCNYVSGRATQIKAEGFIAFHWLAYNLDHFHSNPSKTLLYLWLLVVLQQQDVTLAGWWRGGNLLITLQQNTPPPTPLLYTHWRLWVMRSSPAVSLFNCSDSLFPRRPVCIQWMRRSLVQGWLPKH